MSFDTYYSEKKYELEVEYDEEFASKIESQSEIVQDEIFALVGF